MGFVINYLQGTKGDLGNIGSIGSKGFKGDKVMSSQLFVITLYNNRDQLDLMVSKENQEIMVMMGSLVILEIL